MSMYNILICDDEQDIVNALKIYLSSPDFAFYEASDGLEALQTIDENEIHLVLLDIMMPKMNGIDALSEIRKRSNIPVIMLSSAGTPQKLMETLKLGALDFIQKPYTTVQVKKALEEIRKKAAQNE